MTGVRLLMKLRRSMRMELNKLKQEWDKFGILKPQWAVLHKEGEKKI